MYLLFNFDLLNWLWVITFCLFSFRNSVNFSYDDTQRTRTSLRRLQDVLKRSRRLMTKPVVLKTSGRWRLIYDVLKTSDLRRLEDVWFTSSWKRLICDVLRTPVLRRLEDVGFLSSWRRLICNVLRKTVLRRLEDGWFTTSWRCL